MPQEFLTRFAPSPTGYLHRGHAYSALLAYRRAQSENGRFLLRIEDIDMSRSRPAFIDGIKEDLAWLGLSWETPVRQQSEHMKTYEEALDRLQHMGLLYPCFCSRSNIKAAIKDTLKIKEGPDGPLYPGTCRHLSDEEIRVRWSKGQKYAWRLNMGNALAHIQRPLTWFDEIHGSQLAKPEIFGDVILARKDTPTSYHLAVTLDDHIQKISHVIRGMDLFDATHIHVLLQELLGLAQPVYHHHPLIMDKDRGGKLAKTKGSLALKDLRDQGLTADEIIESTGL